jgi:adenosylmethionine-8-amino-7-oxononanoate aminotransferase
VREGEAHMQMMNAITPVISAHVESGDPRTDDAPFVWHPFTQAKTAEPPRIFMRGEGARLYDDSGHSVLDLISSWWVNLHGHAHPVIAEAIAEQARKLEHVHFAGASHPAAIAYARALVHHVDPPLQRVFYSDNGSTAVEVAIKMALQYWQNLNCPRRRILAFEGGYHGDTFGAMSVGRGASFFSPFVPWMFPVDLLRYATTNDDGDLESNERRALAFLDRYLDNYGHDVAACVLEPLVQGAGGMRIARPAYVRAVAERIQARGILLIFDEVLTGFGRTGTMWAYEQLGGIVPDMLCLAKGMTGGFLPLAATIATEAIYNAFLHTRSERALLHGHSYTANPLGCAAALASLELFEQESTMRKISAMSAIHTHELAQLRGIPGVSNIRQCGTIAAFDVNFNAEDMRQLTRRLYDTDLLIRPLGKTIYFIPPYCLLPGDLKRVYGIIRRHLSSVAD